jgi:hypothetical protein
VLDGWLPSQCSDRLAQRLSVISSQLPGRKALIPDSVFEEFCVSTEVLSLALQLLGESCLLHHANGRILAPGGLGRPWHHDRDGRTLPPNARVAMYHFFFYPRGLSLECAPLVVRPRTHHREVARSAATCLGTRLSPGDIVIRGAPGLTVIMDSARWHIRPRAPGQRPRFDLNVSFVEGPGDWPERLELKEVLNEVARRRGGPWERYFANGGDLL